MTLQQLMPQIENLSREDKTQIFGYLLKDLGAEGDYLIGCIHNPEIMGSAAQVLQELLKKEKHIITPEERKVMEESDKFMKDYFEKYPEELRGCCNIEVAEGTNLMEIFKELVSAKV